MTGHSNCQERGRSIPLLAKVKIYCLCWRAMHPLTPPNANDLHMPTMCSQLYIPISFHEQVPRSNGGVLILRWTRIGFQLPQNGLVEEEHTSTLYTGPDKSWPYTSKPTRNSLGFVDEVEPSED